MDRRMRVTAALIYLMVTINKTHAFTPGTDGPVVPQEALEGGNTTLYCDSATNYEDDELMLLVWYKDDAPIYSFDARIKSEWASPAYDITKRLKADLSTQPTGLNVTNLRGDDQALYHCRVDFLLAPTRNIGVNLTVIVLPSQPFFLDELGNKVENKIGPYHEGDTLVLSCLVIGGRPAPKISWYSGEDLVDASDRASDIPGVRENELYLPLTRSNAADLSCRATNTHLTAPVTATLQIDLYSYNVSINWVNGTMGDTLQAGEPVVVKCVARGSHPAPELTWWLDHKLQTQHTNQSWTDVTSTAESYLRLTPAAHDHGATLTCVATNTAMPPGRDTKADVSILNVTYSPVVELLNQGGERLNQVVELDSLHLECKVKANPPVVSFKWFYNNIEINPNSLWNMQTSASSLRLEEATRDVAGSYSCAASNSIGETRSDIINVTVLYPPECMDQGIKVMKETIRCNVRGLPMPDTYFWHIQSGDEEVQHLTTGSPILALSEITGSLAGTLLASCEAGNGIASQDKPCQSSFHLEHLRPPQPQQCDLVYEYEEFQIRCIPVENATYYEVTVWRMSVSNSSLILERKRTMGHEMTQALAHGGGAPWLVRGSLGVLKPGDEAGASACNKYGCSAALLLRPTDNLLNVAAASWWSFLLEKDVSISFCAVVLVCVFITSTLLLVRLARRLRARAPPVIQVLQLDDAARSYIDSIGDPKIHTSGTLRSCSSGYSDGSMESAPTIDRRRHSRHGWSFEPPPPDVTLTLHRESAV